MITCGLKLTHDGSVVLIEDGRLLFSIEMEKLGNNARYTGIEETGLINQILEVNGCKPTDIDVFAIDGWGGTDRNALAVQPRLEICDGFNQLAATHDGNALKLKVAPYREKTLRANLLERWTFCDLYIAGKSFSYESYLHAAGHVLGAYATSPFAQKNESAYVFVWDGGMYPRLYYYDAASRKVENCGPLFLLIGNIYTIFSQHFGPFKVNGSFAKDDLSVAGKVMAYIAKGDTREEMFEIFDAVYTDSYDKPMGFANVFANEFKRRLNGTVYAEEDILRTFHVYVEKLLIRKLYKKLQRSGNKSSNLCIAGGCALNIKWNSAIRNSGLFERLYIPPFPNDSGSAIGTACCAQFNNDDRSVLDWSVYSGPQMVKNMPVAGWAMRDCSVAELARLLHEENQPVVYLNARAELGPRALGNRSILAPATSPAMKDVLNKVKNREGYRPVSPICMEEKAEGIFNPGIPDPFMLFDHVVREKWLGKIAAVVHLDGTARLQTVSEAQNPNVYMLLQEYEKLSGIPLLCNTSANYKGCGFFPDVESATQWGQVNYVFCDNTLFEKQDKSDFPEIAS